MLSGHRFWVIVVSLKTTAQEHYTFVWITRTINEKLTCKMF